MSIIWMIDNQKTKRNANKMTLSYLIGRQYLETRNSHGGEASGQNDHLKTASKLAERS